MGKQSYNTTPFERRVFVPRLHELRNRTAARKEQNEKKKKPEAWKWNVIHYQVVSMAIERHRVFDVDDDDCLGLQRHGYTSCLYFSFCLVVGGSMRLMFAFTESAARGGG